MAVRVSRASRNTATRCGGGSFGFRFLAEVMAIVAEPRHPGRQWTRECPAVERERCVYGEGERERETHVYSYS